MVINVSIGMLGDLSLGEVTGCLSTALGFIAARQKGQIIVITSHEQPSFRIGNHGKLPSY